MKKKSIVAKIISTVFALALIAPTAAFAAINWPASSSGTNIGAALPADFEPSGAFYDKESDQLYVVSDEGFVARMNTSGGNLKIWELGDDLEGITKVGNYLYLAEEKQNAMYQFDPATGTLTGKSWSFAEWMPGEGSNEAMEGLTYGNGNFYASASNGMVYVFDVNLSVSNSVSVVNSFKPTAGMAISDLSFNPANQTLYVLYRSTSIVEWKSVNDVIEYSLPANSAGSEAFAFKVNCSSKSATVFIGNDPAATHQVWSYSGYPMSCSEADDEGENLPIEISGDRVDNDGDGEIDEFNTVRENGVHPTYGDYDPTSASDFREAVTSYSALKNGKITVTFADDSIYVYKVFKKKSPKKVLLSTNGAGFFYIKNPKNGRTLVINIYTGEVR
jgi:hypothetical protein